MAIKNYELRIVSGIWLWDLFTNFISSLFLPDYFPKSKRLLTDIMGMKKLLKSTFRPTKKLQIREMMEYRIPASIILAQGIYESNAGRSPLSTEANNHFGIKCHKDWTGNTYTQDDETKNECFRKYNSPEESFRDHSLYLSRQDRYKPLFNLEITDYKGWANGLKSCGYATNPQYAAHLIKDN